MKIFIQQTIGGRYWSPTGWVQTRTAATVYRGVVAAVDAVLTDGLADADILMTFGASRFDARLRMGALHRV